MRLDGKVSVSDDVVSGVPQDVVLRPLMYILYTLKLFHIIGNHIVGYADDTTISVAIPGVLSRP